MAKKKLTKKQEAEYQKLCEHLDEHKRYRSKTMGYATRVTKILQRDPMETDVHAEFLARICNTLDTDYGFGSQLALEWMLDHYLALEVERAFPMMEEIWNTLIEKKHSSRNRFEYFDGNEAFFVDDTRTIFVFGGGNCYQYLVQKGPGKYEILGHQYCWVRRIWKKRKLNCIGSIEHPTLQSYKDVGFRMEFNDGPPFRLYGDCRDEGHILTYENCFGDGKCDHALWHLQDALWFFFYLKHLWEDVTGKRDRDD